MPLKQRLAMAYDYCTGNKEIKDFLDFVEQAVEKEAEIIYIDNCVDFIADALSLHSWRERRKRMRFFAPDMPLFQAATGGKTESSNVAWIGYNNRKLRVGFIPKATKKNPTPVPSVYEYDVDPEFYEAMAAAGSKGEFLWRYLRGKTPGRVIDAPERWTPGGVGGSIVPYNKLAPRRISSKEISKLQKKFASHIKRGTSLQEVQFSQLQKPIERMMGMPSKLGSPGKTAFLGRIEKVKSKLRKKFGLDFTNTCDFNDKGICTDERNKYYQKECPYENIDKCPTADFEEGFYSKADFKKDLSEEYKQQLLKEKGRWVTIRGRKVFLPEGKMIHWKKNGKYKMLSAQAYKYSKAYLVGKYTKKHGLSVEEAKARYVKQQKERAEKARFQKPPKSKKDMIHDTMDELFKWVQAKIESDPKEAKRIAFAIVKYRENKGKKAKGSKEEWKEDWKAVGKSFKKAREQYRAMKKGDIKKMEKTGFEAIKDITWEALYKTLHTIHNKKEYLEKANELLGTSFKNYEEIDNTFKELCKESFEIRKKKENINKLKAITQIRNHLKRSLYGKVDFLIPGENYLTNLNENDGVPFVIIQDFPEKEAVLVIDRWITENGLDFDTSKPGRWITYKGKRIYIHDIEYYTEEELHPFLLVSPSPFLKIDKRLDLEKYGYGIDAINRTINSLPVDLTKMLNEVRIYKKITQDPSMREDKGKIPDSYKKVGWKRTYDKIEGVYIVDDKNVILTPEAFWHTTRHEIGHAVWYGLTEADRMKFKQIHKQQKALMLQIARKLKSEARKYDKDSLDYMFRKDRASGMEYEANDIEEYFAEGFHRYYEAKAPIYSWQEKQYQKQPSSEVATFFRRRMKKYEKS